MPALVLISREFPWWRNTVGVLAAIAVVPIAVLIKLVIMPFERPHRRSPHEVAKYLRDFLNGTGGEWDWEDFVCVPIEDRDLENIRFQASSLDLPLTEEGRAILACLLRRTEQMGP